MHDLFAGRKTTIWRGLNAGSLLAAGLVLANANAVTPQLWATQYIVNSQPAGDMPANAITVVTVQEKTLTNQFEAYAQVKPIAVLPLRAVEAGQIIKFEMIPGTRVHAGQKLAELGGPEIQALLARDKSSLKSARTSLLSALKSLAIERRQVASHLTTRRTVLEAEAAAAQAQAACDSARAQLRALQQTITLRAPAAGTVLAVKAAAGERVSAGQTILTLQPANKLWLKAAYYGADTAAIHTGMTGDFAPADGGPPIPVKVATVFGAVEPDGGEAAGLLADVPSPGWLNGEFGTLTLNGSAHSLVTVPTRALILDEGKWWVLVHTARGNHRQRVTPGPTRGWHTFVESGLKPGQQVVTENAYLEFHRGISKTYQPPD